MSAFEINLDAAKARLGISLSHPDALAPIAFTVGDHPNAAGESLGSLVILMEAVEKNLTVGQTLPRFAEHFDQVVSTPEGTDHPNIRALMKHDHEAYVGSIVVFQGEPIVKDGNFESIINDAWDNRADLSPTNVPSHLAITIAYVIKGLNDGRLRVATREATGVWTVHQWIKKAVLLSFRIKENSVIRSGDLTFFDKVTTKFGGMSKDEFRAVGARVVPPAVARYGSFIGNNVILMPSYVNIGAYVGEGTMVDTWATVGSCAQIGKNVHLSGGVGIGGVLEPLQANPTIIEDDCFIGARSEVVEGVIVRQGSVLGMGVFLAQSTPVWDRQKRIWLDASKGLEIPPYSVVISGQKPAQNIGDPSTYCVVIVKTVDAKTRDKTSTNELLRD